MSPSEAEEYILSEPIRPVRLTLASGDQVIVREEDRPIVSGLALVLRGSGAARVTGGPRLVSIPNIALLEPLPERPSNRGRRR